MESCNYLSKNPNISMDVPTVNLNMTENEINQDMSDDIMPELEPISEQELQQKQSEDTNQLIVPTQRFNFFNKNEEDNYNFQCDCCCDYSNNNKISINCCECKFCFNCFQQFVKDYRRAYYNSSLSVSNKKVYYRCPVCLEDIKEVRITRGKN